MSRSLLVAVLVVAGTWLGAPTLAPVFAGVLLGLGWPGRAARQAALGAAAAWAALLLVQRATGTPLGATSATLGGAMGLPPWAPLVATLLYPAILAASAAWIGQLLSPRRGRSAPPVAAEPPRSA